MMDAAATECKEGDQLQARVNVKEGRQSYTGVARLICDLRYPVLVENGFSDMPDEESIVLIACIYRDLRK